MASCICGVIQCLSKAYFTKNTTARNSAKPPTHAKTLMPKNFSQRIDVGWVGAGDGVGDIIGRGWMGGRTTGAGGLGMTAAAGCGTGGGCTTGISAGRGAAAGAAAACGSA